MKQEKEKRECVEECYYYVRLRGQVIGSQRPVVSEGANHEVVQKPCNESKRGLLGEWSGSQCEQR